MPWTFSSEDDYYDDSPQYDTEYAPSAQQLEAEAIRRECYGLGNE